jgi:molybdopterin adenylyltransferase
MPTIYRL